MKFLLIAVALLTSPYAYGQDHLEPEDSVYQGRATQDDILSGYHRDVVKKFGGLYNGGFSARAIVLPSFETEYAIGISSEGESPKIVGLRAETQLWLYSILKTYESGERRNKDRQGNDTTKQLEEELRSSIPPTIDEVALTHCENPITEGDRALFVSLWREMLYDTRYPEKGRFGFDGVSYHFSGDFDQQTLAGQVRRPSDGSTTRRLTETSERVIEACFESSSVKLVEARRLAEALCADIGCEGQLAAKP